MNNTMHTSVGLPSRNGEPQHSRLGLLAAASARSVGRAEERAFHREELLRHGSHSIVAPLRGRALREAHKLRARVFCQELGWVGTRTTDYEIDEFDASARHLGVLDRNERLVGTVRFLTSSHEWLMERHFSNLLPPNFDELKQQSALEVSRLAVDSGARATRVDGSRSVVELLYKGIFRYCRARSIDSAYIVVSAGILKHLKVRSMPVRPIGPITRMPDGVVAVAAVLDWAAFLASTDERQRKLRSWFLENECERD
jgi:N-acyl-L-homoserine lactone synthetase